MEVCIHLNRFVDASENESEQWNRSLNVRHPFFLSLNTERRKGMRYDPEFRGPRAEGRNVFQPIFF